MASPICGPFQPPHPAAALFEGRLEATYSQPPPSAAAIAAAHRVLYGQVPGFDCIPGCHACCGTVTMTAWEWARVDDQRFAAPDCRTCPYASPEGCAIHPDRPLICRLFGAVDDPRMTCPKGCGPARKLSAQHARNLMRAYQQLVVDSAPRELHQNG